MGEFGLTEQDFLVLVFLSPFNGLFPPLPEVQCPNFLDFWNPLGKVMERSGLRFETFAHKECKIAVSKKFFYIVFFFICSLCLNVFLSKLLKVQYPSFLDFRNPWGKVIERKGLRFGKPTAHALFFSWPD